MTMTTSEWLERNQQWFGQIDRLDMNHATIQRRDQEKKGCWIGPLATVPIGMTEDDDDGEQVACLDEGEDGITLWLVLLLPQIADTLMWIKDALSLMNGIHFDKATDAGEFHCELRRRVELILGEIEDRPARIGPGVFTV